MKVKGVLVKDVVYPKNGYTVTVKEGVEILVDVDNGIALINNDHVDIYKDEYQLIN